MEQLADAWESGRTDAVDDLLAPDVVSHTAWGDLDGVEAYKAWMADTHESLSDVAITLDETMVFDDRVVGQYTFEGRHTGPFAGVDPTGEDVSFTGCVIARFEGDRCVEDWNFANTISVLGQIGAIPGPDVAA